MNFNWSGYLLVEGTEVCGNDEDEDCDGETDNGCGTAELTASCYYDTDCQSGYCEGVSIVSGMGEGGEALADDTPGVCTPPPPFCGPIQLDTGFHTNGVAGFASPERGKGGRWCETCKTLDKREALPNNPGHATRATT